MCTVYKETGQGNSLELWASNLSHMAMFRGYIAGHPIQSNGLQDDFN